MHPTTTKPGALTPRHKAQIALAVISAFLLMGIVLFSSCKAGEGTDSRPSAYSAVEGLQKSADAATALQPIFGPIAAAAATVLSGLSLLIAALANRKANAVTKLNGSSNPSSPT